MQLLYHLNHYNKPQQIVTVATNRHSWALPAGRYPLGGRERERSLRCKVRKGKGGPKQRGSCEAQVLAGRWRVARW